MTQITLPRETVQGAIDAIEKAFDFYDGDVFGVMHNDVTDTLAALRTALAAPAATVSMQWLAEMIMSDCGCSTNNQRLLDRIINRIDQYERANAAPAAREPLTDEQLREAFGKLYPRDIGILELAENNRDFAVEAIGARHHWTAFKAGAKAIEAAHGIGKEQK